MEPSAVDEWMCWRVICRMLSVRGIDIDAAKNEPLVRALRHYGAAYLALFEGSEARHPTAKVDAEQTRLLYAELK